MKQKKRINPAFYIMTVPMAVLFFCFHTFPFLQGVFYSFTDWKGYGNWNFVGLRNYLHIFQDKMSDIRICSRLNLQYAQRYL